VGVASGLRWSWFYKSIETCLQQVFPPPPPAPFPDLALLFPLKEKSAITTSRGIPMSSFFFPKSSIDLPFPPLVCFYLSRAAVAIDLDIDFFSPLLSQF